ncbi:MAG: YraN family protein [Chitinophagaceae bacterium]|jgi:putative endonuclease
MSKHNEIGTNGELLAVNFLKNKGFIILETNWRSGKKEIDIIVENDETIIFVEVKTRSNFNFGFPEEAVSETKKSFLKIAAEDYFIKNNCNKDIRFDVISIIQRGKTAAEIIHFEDAFF